jgi:hypothetical protein
MEDLKLKEIAEDIAKDFEKLSKSDQQYVVTRMSVFKVSQEGNEEFIKMLTEVFMKNQMMVNSKLFTLEVKDKDTLLTYLKTFMYNVFAN